MLLSSVLDPRFKALKFLRSSERAEVYSKLLELAIVDTVSPAEALPAAKRPRPEEDLLEYTANGSTNGSSPNVERSNALEKEVDQYKGADQIGRFEDPLH